MDILTSETLFNNDNVYYLGECFYVTFDDKSYSFVKGYLHQTPRSFLHSRYNVNIDQCAAYVLHDMASGKMYIGSSGKVYNRVGRHKQLISLAHHPNENFNALLKTTNLKNFELIMVFTETREEAYALEQLLVNCFKTTGQLLNIAHDVRYAMLGRPLSQTHKERISASNRNPIVTPETRKKLSDFHKTNSRAVAQFKDVLQSKRRCIMVDGVAYESLTQAAERSGLTESAIRKLMLSNAVSTRWLSDNASPLVGRTQTETHRQKLSVFRKTNMRAQAQFAAATEKTQKKIILNGTLYNSVTAAVNATGISESVLHQNLNKQGGRTEDGPYVLNYTKQSPHRVMIDGVVYKSLLAAAQALSLSKNTLKSRVRSGKLTYLL